MKGSTVLICLIVGLFAAKWVVWSISRQPLFRVPEWLIALLLTAWFLLEIIQRRIK
jgi:hypothetical protein